MIRIVRFFKYRMSLFLLLAITLQTSQLLAQDVKIDARFDSTQILIGDQIKFRINIDQPEGAMVKVPAFTEKIAEKIEVLKVFLPDTVKQDNRLKVSYEYLVTSFDSGEYVLPSIAMPVTTGSRTDTLRVTPEGLTVLPVVTDTVTQVKDIKPPLNTPINFAELWPYIAGFVLLVAIVWFVFYYLRKQKKGVEPVRVKRNEPPHVLAIQELDKLRAEKLWQNNMVKQYYVRLSEIVRVYAGERYGIEALEMTTEEIVESLRRAIVEEPGSVELVKNLLTLADLVKFAKANPLPNENEVSLLNAYQFVNNTKPVAMGSMQSDEQDPTKEDNNQEVFNS